MSRAESAPSPKRATGGRSWRRWALAAAAVAALAVAGWLSAEWLAPYFTRQQLESWVRAAGPWGPLVLMGVQAAQILAAPIPGLFVPILAGVLYGPVVGALLTTGGSLLGSTAAYWIGRSAGRAVAERWVGSPALLRAQEMMQGKRWLALAAVFLLPFSPADALCFMAGILGMGWTPFLGAVLVGRIPKDALLAAGAALGWTRIGLGAVG